MLSILAAAAAPAWVEYAIGMIVTSVLPFLVQYLRAGQKAHEAAAAKLDIERGAALAERVKSFVIGTAANFAERRFPKLAEDVKTGRLRDPAAIKSELRSWGQELKQDAVAHFQTQDIDLLKEFSDQWLDNIIERAANKVSPFPGKEAATAILEDNVSDMLVNKGVDFVKSKFIELSCMDCSPRCAGCPPKQAVLVSTTGA